MPTRIIKTNYKDKDLICDYCKKPIEIGETYCIEFREFFGAEMGKKNWKLDYMNKIDRIFK